MEIELMGISFHADLYDIKSEFARILHSDYFRRPIDQEERLMNFLISLGESASRRHNGTGLLILSSRASGNRLLDLARRDEEYPSVRSRRILMRESWRKPRKEAIEVLRKLPYQDPNIDRERDAILLQLNVSWRVDKLQFGIWLHQPHIQLQKGQRSIFAVEWEKDYTAVGNAQLAFEYDRKFLKLCLGDPSLDNEAYSVIIKFSNIQQMWSGYEYKPYICFSLLTPAIFETEWFNRTKSGVHFEDTRKFRQRVGALDSNHQRICAYAHHIRISLYHERDLEEFERSCAIAGLRKPTLAKIISEGHSFFSQKLLLKLRSSLREFAWTTAFQVECLLRNGLLTTVQILGLLPSLSRIAQQHPAVVGIILRDYALLLRSTVESFIDNGDVGTHFESFCTSRLNLNLAAAANGEGLISCHHVTFTPTRMLLEGPYVIQSNRVLRRYDGYHDYFLRVDFRDEDRLQFRWHHEVDGTTILEHRVGETLRKGFDLAGRHFEFLAYSSSALREHAVWFVSPFQHAQNGLVNSASIRREEGDFSGDLAYPAKFAARLALAFTATVPSVKITKDQWKMIPDLGVAPYLHTDGVGTISRELGHQIWSEYCIHSSGLERHVEPCAYMIRFLGFKGVVAIDDSLEGIKMCLRQSMMKFRAHEVELADIEIAKAFYSPRILYLNRPLVMVLEDQGARKEAFIKLLNEAISEIRLACDSIEHLVTLMRKHGLASTFGLCFILEKLASYGLDLNPRDSTKSLRSPFVDQLVNCTVASVLRDIQYRCRVPVPRSYSLVGIADEGTAYIQSGRYKAEEVFTLKEGEIFACIQRDRDSQPIYLERNCTISRSPTLYPGDVQRMYAVGKPPADKVCAFRNLVNVVVLPSTGIRSLASCLSGGDLDGDEYDICLDNSIFGSLSETPADFPPVPKWKIDLSELAELDPETGESKVNQEKIIPHVCDFIVQYINSDVLGMLSTNHLIRADQSSDGVRDKGCQMLAKLCNEAVDYPKNGRPVDISRMPLRLIPYKPDWTKGEASDERPTDFYRSERAVGEIFRRVEQVASGLEPGGGYASTYVPTSEHPIYISLKPKVDARLRDSAIPETPEEQIKMLFGRFAEELGYICATHTLTDLVSARLKEKEVVVGTILARCSQHRWRTDRIYRMKLHVSNLEKEIKEQFVPKHFHQMTTHEVKESLDFAWTSWRLVTDKLATPEAQKNSFGLNSFSFIALHIVFQCLDVLEKR